MPIRSKVVCNCVDKVPNVGPDEGVDLETFKLSALRRRASYVETRVHLPVLLLNKHTAYLTSPASRIQAVLRV